MAEEEPRLTGESGLMSNQRLVRRRAQMMTYPPPTPFGSCPQCVYPLSRGKEQRECGFCGYQEESRDGT